MKSEFYVVNLIQSDDDACRKVSGHLGLDSWLQPRELLAELANPDIVQTRGSNVFEELRQILDGRLPDSAPLSYKDLQILYDHNAQTLLGKRLGCPAGESIQMLFAADELASLLEAVGILRPRGPGTLWDDSEYLLSHILEANSKLQAVGITDIFGELNYHLRENVRQDLAQQLQCAEEETLEALVRAIKKQITPPDAVERPEGGKEYDVIALSRLRSYLREFRDRLLRDAVQESSKAQMRLPGHRAPAVLSGLIEYCMGCNYKVGLNGLLAPRQFLRECPQTPLPDCPDTAGTLETVICPLDPQSDEAQPAPMNAAGAQKVVAQIQLRSSPNARPLPVAKLQVTQDEAEQISHRLPKTADKLSKIGTTILERLLNTPLPIFSRWRRTLHGIMRSADGSERLDDSFVQAFVLAGVSFDAPSLVPGLRPPLARPSDADTRARVSFPKGVDEIVLELEEEYRKNGRTVTGIGLTTQRPR